MSNIDWTQRKAAPTVADQLQAAKDAMKARATARRWECETGGITLQGVCVLTGIEDQNRITTVVANAQRAGLPSVDFKSADGWMTISVAEVEAIASAIALHVQASFTAERAHHEAIDALQDLTAVQTYDAEQGWPAG